MQRKNNVLKKIKRNPHNYRKVILFIISLLFLIFPLVVMGRLYYVGGDDTRLYYLFPEEFIKNFAANIISDNTLGGANTGYGTAAHFIPFVFVIEILKKTLPFVNTQALLYGLNFSFAFIFFYLFVSLWIKNENDFNFFSKVIAGVFYVTSPFLVSTLYVHQLLSLYLVFLMPAMLYFFCRGVMEKKYVFSLIVAFLFSVFSTTLNTTPWWLPIIITGIPILIYLLINYPKSLLINALILSVSALLLNYYWLYHFINSNINKMGAPSSADYYSTKEYEEANLRGVMNLTRIMNPLVPVIQKYDFRFKDHFSFLWLKNLIFIAVISFAGIFSSNKKTGKYAYLYWISLACFLISWFLFSPNFSNWGPGLFIKFVKTIPFGIMFRNMFDKFALPLAFYFAFALSFSLILINQSIWNSILKKILLITLALVIISNMPAFFRFTFEIQGAKGLITGKFDKDFLDMVSYLKSQGNASRILWVPITAPNYVSVEDGEIKGNYYSGLSPLRILADRNDYAGRYSFMLPNDVFFGDKIFDLLKKKDYENFAKEMQRLNVRYLIVDKQDLPRPMYSYLYDEDLKYLNLQDQQYRNFILGDKIKDFGKNYSLYLINKKFINDKLFLTDQIDEFPEKADNLEYQKVSSFLYKVSIKNLNSKKLLVFLESFNKGWSLYLTSSTSKTVYKKEQNVLAEKWANGWELDPMQIKKDYEKSFYKQNVDGSIDIDLDLYFEPQTKNKQLYYFTITAYSLSLLIIIVYSLRRIIK